MIGRLIAAGAAGGFFGIAMALFAKMVLVFPLSDANAHFVIGNFVGTIICMFLAAVLWRLSLMVPQ